MNIFKIPKDKNAPNTKIIGVIDASGSMSGNWAWLAKFWNEFIPADNALTITFDTIAKVCESNRLDTNINKHGGGGTNITRAFEMFEQKLKDIPKDLALTVIFISDGQDNNLHTLESRFQNLKGNAQHSINFICLGVGAGFPTFLSMKLREKYHRGDETLPAIFLIEYASEKAFLNKFESIKPFFGYNQSRRIKPAVFVLPWREYAEEVYENGWVMTDADKVDIEDEEIDVSKYRYNLEGVVEIFRSWTQMIHLDSLNSQEDIKNRAEKTLAIMEDLIKEIKESKGIDILNLRALDEQEGLSFGQLALNNFLKHTVSRAAWFYEDIKLLAEGKTPKELNEFDAAKRIGIGTIVGKYHQKAFALKGVTVEDFVKIRDEFKQIYLGTKLDPNSNQEASIITLQTQKEIFLQKDFLKGLDLCNTQFDLVESFPIIGQAIKIKRYDGSRLNPWLIDVRFIARHNKAIDSISILRNSNALTLNTGEDRTETINAVLPLFDKTDADLKPLISSKLYHLLMTFNAVQNVDTLYEEAYLALLANTLLYLLREPESEWRDQLLQAIHTTCHITYYNDQNFLKYREALLKEPATAIEKDEEQLKFGSIDLSKAVLHLFLLRQDKIVDEHQVEQILSTILQKAILKVMKNKDTKLESYLKVKAHEGGIEDALNGSRANFNKYRTKGEFRRGVQSEFEKQWSKSEQYDFTWDITNLSKIEEKIDLDLMDAISKALTGNKPTKEDYVKYIVLAASCKDLMDCLANKDKNIAEFTGKLAKKLTLDINKGGASKNPQCQEAIKKLEPEFYNWFREAHQEILPISVKTLRDHCQKANISYEKYQWLSYSDLLRNACLAPKCPFYLNLDDHLGHHLAVWENNLPLAFHKTVKKNLTLSNEEIYVKFENGECARTAQSTFAPENYGVTKEFTLQYIETLKKAYNAIKVEN